MRYIPISSLKSGMVLANPVYGPSVEVLLSEGMTLSSSHVKKLNQMGYVGVYIFDDISEDIKVKDILPAEIRINTIRAAKETWRQAERGGVARSGARVGSAKMERTRQDKIVMPIIESLIENQRRIVELIDLKPEDEYLYYHTANVVILSVLIGLELGLSGVQLYELALSALLHDVGNIFIPKALLEKPGKLTPEEFATIKSHTQMGFDYLRNNFEISIEGCMGALQHHENYDGSGYPTGLKKKKISIYGRIIAITDVYDALTSRRPFRRMLYPNAAMDYLNINAGTIFDPEIIAAFQRIVPLYPTGLCVELDSGVRGIVCENFIGDPERPKVRLLNSSSEIRTVVDLHGDQFCGDIGVARIIELD